MIAATSFALTPAEKLVGQVLPGGWTVCSYINKQPGATGGFFSIGYVVKHENGKDKAFLKAIDFSMAFSSSDPTTELEKLTQTFNFERELLQKCKSKNFDRVVKALEFGSLIIDGMPVPYIIFEMADSDMRAHMDLSSRFDLAGTLRMLHHVTVGLGQLHSVGIAHQDLKPSNVLIFRQFISKLADLGRSAHPDHKVPHDENTIPGGLPYAPPELRYAYTDPNFNVRRFGADTFLLGNIILFAFTRLTMSAVLFSFVAPQHMPITWKGTYQEVLPYLQNAFDVSLDYVSHYIDQAVREDIIAMLRQLCEPDLTKRGHPLSRGSYSLERYISKLNLLAYKAERNLF
jgi:eukaryotic-like serine/threonine-protein kinase